MNVSIVLWLVSMLATFEPIDEIETLYYRGSYDDVLAKVAEFVNEDSALDKRTRIELRKYAAFSYVALGETNKAMEEFREILALDSTVTFDPELVSPKILEVFDAVKEEFKQHEHNVQPLTVNTLHPDLVSGSLSLRTATLRSFAFPGVGQLYLGEKEKGWLYVAGEGLSLGGLIISQVFMTKAHDYYTATKDTLEMEARYKVYNNWYHARNALGGLALGIWISAPLEILFFPPSWARNR